MMQMPNKLIQSDDRFRIYQNGKLRVVLDRQRVVPDDPGADTPAMVYFDGDSYKASATYWCALGEGELQITTGIYKHGFHKVTNLQCKWLESLDSELTKFLYLTNPICIEENT